MPRALSHIVDNIDSVSRYTGKVTSFSLLIVVVVALIEIVCRYILNRPTIFAYETAQFIFGAYFLLGGAYTLLYRQHIGMDVILSRLSVRNQAIVNAATSILTFLFCFVLLWKGGVFGVESVKHLEHSTSVWGPPVYPFKMMLPISGGLVLLQAIANLIKDLTLVTTKNFTQEVVQK